MTIIENVAGVLALLVAVGAGIIGIGILSTHNSDREPASTENTKPDSERNEES